jgi:hypothetical protein
MPPGVSASSRAPRQTDRTGELPTPMVNGMVGDRDGAPVHSPAEATRSLAGGQGDTDSLRWDSTDHGNADSTEFPDTFPELLPARAGHCAFL